jgi:hypothetical protein
MGWLVCWERIWFRTSRVLRISLAWISMSETCPPLAVGLMDHHVGVGQGERPAVRPPGSPAAGRGLRNSGHRATQDLHRVVHRQRGRHVAAGGIDVEADLLAAILALQIEQLHHHLIGVAREYLPLEEDDPVLQQQVAERELPLPLVVAIRRRCGSNEAGVGGSCS